MDKTIQSIHKKLSAVGINGIELCEKGSSIQLQGELSQYSDVVKAGKIASKYGYKGVINDITTKGKKPAEIIKPDLQDNSLNGKQYDVVIIGGGVIGCSIARELSKYHMSILLLEKECDVAMQASSRNDGMIHPGIATHLHGNTASYNVRGNKLYTQLCNELGVPFQRTGNLIVFKEKNYHLFSPAVIARSKYIGVEYKHLSKKELFLMEPNITDDQEGGFIFPSSGVLSPYKLTVALAENAVQNGVTVALSTIVTGMTKTNGKITEVITNRGRVIPCIVINAAGVFADKIAEFAGDRFFTIHPRKGELIILDKKKSNLFTASMGVLNLKQLSGDTKGGGLVHTIDDNVLVGPNAIEVMDREDYSTDRERVDKILQKQLPLIKGLSKADVITYFSGVRAPTYEENFIVEASETVKNLVYAAGIQSPGLASAPAIAQDVAEITISILGKSGKVKENVDYNPYNKLVNMSKMSFEQKQALIQKNPDYGVIVCRCEEISKGEIIDALDSPIPVYTLDGIKRRVRPGMGRCQGGFCSPIVAQMIAQKSGINLIDVTKKGTGSKLLVSTTRKGEDSDV
ncbi:MAG: NAD(P)/FAD-dependent oxidoreductase [Oscillospiraceae bacterium]